MLYHEFSRFAIQTTVGRPFKPRPLTLPSSGRHREFSSVPDVNAQCLIADKGVARNPR